MGQSTQKETEYETPTIISGKTGLTPAEDALMKNLPDEYMSSTIGDALGYLMEESNLDDQEIFLARSLDKEMRSGQYVVIVNGKNADLSDKLDGYIEQKEHQLPNNEVKYYNSLEIEVSSVQEGGLCSFL